jgi:PKD repeat protein
MKTNFLRNLLTVLIIAVTTLAQAANVNVTTDITTNTFWTNNNTYILFGDIIVKSGATLSIQEGTIIKGDKSTISRIVVAIGGKIVAQGTPEQPIVFTSNQPAGSRSRGDWAGIAICGAAPVNLKNSGGASIQGRIECGSTTDYDYGGSNADDSSGILSYVRVEYAGFVCGTNTELNSITMGGVGRKTKIDHVMISYGQDDGFEWFGGNVNASELISFGARDDDFDTDNGYSGKVQNGLIIRLDTIADQGDVSNAFESDNDVNGTYNTPSTAAVFSNITVVGPAETKTSVIDSKYGWALRIRRNSSISVFNSLFIGYKRGLRFEGTGTQTKASVNDTLEFKNNIIAGSKEQYYETAFDSVYLLNQPSNTVIRGNANDTVRLFSPYGNPNNYNFLPQAGSPALSGASFSYAKLAGFAPTTYRGAFGSSDWTNCWAEFTPQDEDYSSSINYAYTASLTPSGATTICQGSAVDLTATSSAPGSTYLWSNGATTPSISVSASGNYTVTVANARGCTKTFSQIVTVNSNPATPVITPSATSFCTGSAAVTLSSDSATSYVWSNGATTKQISVSNPGSFTVTVTNANNCSASSNAVQITENTPLVPAITADGPTTFCTGGSVNLVIGNSANFASFVWNNNSTNDTLTATATGTFNVTTTDLNSCTATSNTITTSVSSSPSPTISATGAVAFCSGDSVVISSSAGDTYLWSNGATSSSITVKQSGTFTVTVTNADACLGTGGSNTINVVVTPTPVASFTQALGNNSYTIAFTNTTTNGSTYNWDFGNGQSSTNASPTHVYTQNGSFTVTLVANNGTCSSTSTGTVSIIGVGLNDVENAIEAISLYPNPNNGLASLEVTTTKNTTVIISVLDMTGRVLTQINTEINSGSNQVELNTSTFAAGLYLVNVNIGAEQKIVRMSVSK